MLYRSIPLADLADFVHPRSSQRKALALLRAYFDETGIHDGALVTAIGGFVATQDAWSELETEWVKLIDEFASRGVRQFHMTDFLAQKGEFERMDGPLRNYMLTRISELLASADVRGIFSAVVCDDWVSTVRDAEFLSQFPKPFFLCFEDVTRQLWEWSGKYAGGEPVAPMFAHQPEYHDRMAAVGQYLANTDWYPRFLVSITFGTPDRFIPLQAADFAAFSVREDIENRHYEPGAGHQTVAFHTATQGNYVHGHWFNAKALELTVERFCETGEIYPLCRFE
ncbi:MAG: DUF3800 domain-containing protein [Alphaproteobacteria bacterium]|nr:DUF3800 domain-containing protein [Alphaproteobacteria bacterium]